jgi:hypothetical protein
MTNYCCLLRLALLRRATSCPGPVWSVGREETEDSCIEDAYIYQSEAMQ